MEGRRASLVSTPARGVAGFGPRRPGGVEYVDRRRGWSCPSLKWATTSGISPSPGGALGASGFERRSYTLCRQRGNPLPLTFDSDFGTSAYTERLKDPAVRVRSCRLGNWGLWAISPCCMDSQEELARIQGLTTSLVSDPDTTVAKNFRCGHSGRRNKPGRLPHCPDHTLLWKQLWVHEPTPPSAGTDAVPHKVKAPTDLSPFNHSRW